MVKHTQRICWLIADELFECGWPFCDHFTRLLTVDGCASIFQINFSITVSGGMSWVDSIDGIWKFLSVGTTGWLKIL